MEDTTPDENSRTTRSRNTSLSEGNILDFSKPTSITTPGCYQLSSATSGCSLTLFNDVFPSQHCELILAEIEAVGGLKQYSATHKGEQVMLPRLSSWFGPIDYSYSGLTMKGNSVSDCPRVIAAYKKIAENLLKPNGIIQTADCFLVNQYRTGRDSCGEHSDNEPEVSRSSPIVTLSLGQSRIMLIREMKNPGNAISVKLAPGSVLIMNGENFQGHYTHQIPKDNTCVQARTSITYRTCDPVFLNQKNALSTSLVDIILTPNLLATMTESIPSSKPSNLSSQRRSSMSLKLDNSIGSASVSPLNSPSLSSTKSGKVDFETTPMSLEAMCEAIESLKDRTIKSELTRLGCSTSGTLIELKKRLKKAVKDCYKRQVNQLLQPSGAWTDNESDSMTTAIETLEKSIVDLQTKISTQHTVLQTLVLCSASTSKKDIKASSSSETSSTNDSSAVDRRLEKIEEIMSSVSHIQNESASLISNCHDSLKKIESDTAETKVRLFSVQSDIKKAPQLRERRPQRQPNSSQNAGNSSRSRSQAKRSKKVLLLHDSQLNNFKPDSFSSGFNVEKQKVGSYKDLASKHMRDVLSKPQVDCYILQLGVNDYRYTNCDSSLKKALDDAKSCIEKLLTSSSAKVMVSLPTPTPGSISERTSEFVQELSEFISAKRRLSDYHRRLFSVNNTGNFNRAISAAASSTDSPNPLNPDQLHVSEYGLKKLCINLKFGLYRSFGMNPPKKQASPEPEST